MKSTPTLSFGSARSFGSPGSGGSLGFADPETGIGYGYVTSQMGTEVTGDPRDVAIRKALDSAVSRRIVQVSSPFPLRRESTSRRTMPPTNTAGSRQRKINADREREPGQSGDRRVSARPAANAISSAVLDRSRPASLVRRRPQILQAVPRAKSCTAPAPLLIFEAMMTREIPVISTDTPTSVPIAQ